MSQLIACQNAHGIVLATDGKAIHFDPTGKMIELKVDRLVQLSRQTAILTGGAADGVEMCHALRNFLQEEKLEDIQEVYGASLPFLSTEFERFMRKRCEILPEVKKGMEKVAKTQEEIGPPFSFASITKEGFRRAD